MIDKTITTRFPEIFDRWGIQNEDAETRKEKPSVSERHAAAVAEISRHAKMRAGWRLMPVLWLEAKASELREASDRAASAKKAKAEAAKKAREAYSNSKKKADAKAKKAAQWRRGYGNHRMQGLRKLQQGEGWNIRYHAV